MKRTYYDTFWHNHSNPKLKNYWTMANPVLDSKDEISPVELLPQPLDGDAYTYTPHEDIERLFFPEQQQQQQGEQLLLLSPGQLTWVCKSKGRKHKQSRRKQLSTTNDDDDDDDDDCSGDDENSSSNSGNKKSQQRLELFLRARIFKHIEYQGEPRVRVQYPAGSTYAVRHDHLVPILEHARNLVLVLPETDLYRRCCVLHTLPAETFVEIGCAAGITVQRVWETGQQRQQQNQGSTTSASASESTSATSRVVVGIDKSELSIRDAQQRYPDLCQSFFLWDVLADPAPPAAMMSLLESQHKSSPSPDVVAMDINGTRELPAVLECLQAVWKLWRPRLVIIKSRALYAVVTSSSSRSSSTK
jgi:hypothetical protein